METSTHPGGTEGPSPSRFWTLLALILGAAAVRLVPHPPNFAPIAALALFGGSTFSKRWQAILIPFLALFLSDAGLELLFRAGLSDAWGFHSGVWVVYLGFAAIVGIGFVIRGRLTSRNIILASLTGSLLFWTVTNFAWFGWLYPHDISGFVACYTAALPFLWPSLGADLLFSAALFGTLAGVEAFAMRTRPALVSSSTV